MHRLDAVSDAGAAAPIPAYVNPGAKRGAEVLDALREDRRFAVREAAPARFASLIREEVESGTPRLLVAGGDGTVASAAREIAESRTELAIVPGGTLNHFARDLGVPLDVAEALDLATAGTARPVDAAEVNERLFLNTSSVGAYVRFVRMRERLERYLGYRLASLVAAVRLLARLRAFAVSLEVEDEQRRYVSPLVFVGVGERELRLPSLGARVEDGRRGLHVIVVRGDTRARVIAVGLAASLRGTWASAQSRHIDSFVADRCAIELPRARGRIALDGEIVAAASPLEYRALRGTLRVVAPEPERPARP